MIVKRAAVRSAAPPARLWEILLDGRRWAEWSETAEWMVVEGDLATGGYVTIKRCRARQTAFRIEAVEPERLLGLALTFGPLARVRVTWALRSEDDGSAIELAVASEGPLHGLLSDGFARRAATTFAADVERLAHFAAGGGG